MFPSFNPGIRQEIWNEPIICSKLQGLKVAKKGKHWIHTDLSVSESSCSGRLFWKIAKHFNYLRDLYYVNPDRALSILESLGWHLRENGSEDLKRLHALALENFEAITGHRQEMIGLCGTGLFGLKKKADSCYWKPDLSGIVTVVPVPVQPDPIIIREIPGVRRTYPLPVASGRMVPPAASREWRPAATNPPTIAGRVVPGTGRAELERVAAPVLMEPAPVRPAVPLAQQVHREAPLQRIPQPGGPGSAPGRVIPGIRAH